MLLFFFPCHVRAAKRPCISAKRALYLRARGLIHCTKYPLPCIAVEYTKVHRNGARAPPCVTWELPPKTPVPLHKKPCISANEACIYLCKRTLYLCKRGLYLRKRAMHLCKKSNVSLQKEPCISAKEQCISAKRALYLRKRAMYLCQKSPVSPQKEPCITTQSTPYLALQLIPRNSNKTEHEHRHELRESCQKALNLARRALCLRKKSPVSPHKEPYISAQKSPVFPQKEPYISGKRALYLFQKSHLSPHTRLVLLHIVPHILRCNWMREGNI